MIGVLTNEQIEQVLRSAMIGRIACSDGRNVYVVPVTYVFDGKFIYAHSREGLKVKIMRKHPVVRFEVDTIETMASWRSVIIQGTYQELTTRVQQEAALKILKVRLAPYQMSETMKPRGFDHVHNKIEKERKPVIYRIRITSMTGRYEKAS